jgi:hypothetical protein
MPDWTVGEEGRQAEWRGEGVHRLAGRRGPRRPQEGPSLPADVLAEEAVTLVCPLCLGPVRVPPTAPDLELLRWRGLACDTCVALA